MRTACLLLLLLTGVGTSAQDSTKTLHNYLRLQPGINQIILEYERVITPKSSLVISSGYIYALRPNGFSWYLTDPYYYYSGLNSKLGIKWYPPSSEKAFVVTGIMHKYLHHPARIAYESGSPGSSYYRDNFRSDNTHVFALYGMGGIQVKHGHFSFEAFTGISIKYVESRRVIYRSIPATGGGTVIYDPPLNKVIRNASMGLNLGIRLGLGW